MGGLGTRSFFSTLMLVGINGELRDHRNVPPAPRSSSRGASSRKGEGGVGVKRKEKVMDIKKEGRAIFG